MWRLKNSCSLANCQKLKTNFKKTKNCWKKTWETVYCLQFNVRLGPESPLDEREEIFLKQHKKFQIKKEEDKLLINK
jgi:hypothetical protein